MSNVSCAEIRSVVETLLMPIEDQLVMKAFFEVTGIHPASKPFTMPEGIHPVVKSIPTPVGTSPTMKAFLMHTGSRIVIKPFPMSIGTGPPIKLFLMLTGVRSTVKPLSMSAGINPFLLDGKFSKLAGNHLMTEALAMSAVDHPSFRPSSTSTGVLSMSRPVQVSTDNRLVWELFPSAVKSCPIPPGASPMCEPIPMSRGISYVPRPIPGASQSVLVVAPEQRPVESVPKKPPDVSPKMLRPETRESVPLPKQSPSKDLFRQFLALEAYLYVSANPERTFQLKRYP